jgi:hypothetical protein
VTLGVGPGGLPTSSATLARTDPCLCGQNLAATPFRLGQQHPVTAGPAHTAPRTHSEPSLRRPALL